MAKRDVVMSRFVATSSAVAVVVVEDLRPFLFALPRHAGQARPPQRAAL